MSPDPQRDWDKELAEIDRLMGKTPPPTPAARAPAPAPAGTALPPAPRSSRRETLLTWARVVLAAGLAAAMTQWPYARDCGVPLVLYTGAIAVVAVAGLWGAVAAWRRRMAAAHAVALAVVGWALALAAAVILPRVGYARDAASWWCS